MMKRFLKSITSITLAIAISFPIPAHSMGTGNQYLDAQSGLSYTVYSPKNTLGFKESSFKLLKCASVGDDWIAVSFKSGKKLLEIYQNRFDLRCSDPGLSKRLKDIKIGASVAKVFVYCDPTNVSKHKKCNEADIKSVGGYLLFTAPGASNLKRTFIQVQGTGGVTYAELLRVAKSLTPINAK